MTVTDQHHDNSDGIDDVAFLRQVIDTTGEGILAFRAVRDDDGALVDFTFTLVNEVSQRRLAPTGESWIGRRLREHLPSTLTDGRYQLLVDAVESCTAQQVEISSTFQDGSHHRLTISARPRGDDVVVSIRDITQAHATIEALAESEQRYRELVEHQAELVCRFLPDTTILFANEAYARYYGRTSDELIGTKMIDLVHPDRHDEAFAAIHALSVEHPTSTDEGYLVAPDGSTRWQQWTTSAVAIEDGRITEVQAVGIDITARKLAEMQANARSEMLALVSRINQRFIDVEVDRVDAAIDLALSDLGESLGVDRTYVVLYQPDRVHLDMTHEWCAPGVASVKTLTAGVPDVAMPRIRELLMRSEMVSIGSFGELDDTWHEEKAAFARSGVRSTLIMPIVTSGTLTGSVGFDVVAAERQLSDQEAAILSTAAAAFGQVLARREAEIEVRRSEQRFRALVAGVPDLLVRVNREGMVLDWRLPSESTDHRTPETVVGWPLEESFPELVPAVERALGRDGEGVTLVEAFEVSWGQAATSFEARITVAGAEAIAVVRDVTEQQRLQTSLLHQATHDALTGLANRRLFAEHLNDALAHGRQSGALPAVLFIDLDQFKVLNDSQGHDVGDSVLQTISRRLARSVRPGDIVARLGGDEFAVLSHRIDSSDDAVGLAERIVTLTAEPIEVDGDTVVITASVGVVVATAESTTASVLRDADAAMYQAKARGRRRVEVFTAEIREAAMARHRVEHDLRRALDDDQLELYYQPLWSLVHRRWVGVEALVRWNHPERGLLLPGMFLPVADDAGLMPQLGSWVLDRACRDLACWRATRGSGMRAWINLSADQLMSHCLVEDVAAAMAAYGVDSSALGVEVTETAVVGDINQARSTLSRLRSLGVSVALDDFGTGLSSLTHLDSLPLDVVKLDGAFVAGAGAPGRQRDLVDGIVTLVRRLGLEVLAERVESEAEMAALQELGVDSLQGYYLGRPMPVGDLSGFLDDPRVAGSA